MFKKILDFYHPDTATILGKNAHGFPMVRINSINVNHNMGARITNQPTNVFIIKGTTSPSIVPTNPGWKPAR